MLPTDGVSCNRSFAEDVDRGLSRTPKCIPCIYFYDYKGSLLFEKICQLPEYYLTRAEAEILETYSEEIISQLSDDMVLAELGSGSSIKTELLIEEMLNQFDNVTYSPIDISQKMLEESSLSLLERYEELEIVSVAAEYGEGLKVLDEHHDQPKLLIWLGSSIGNFATNEAIRFLRDINKHLSRDDLFLIGFDLIKEKSVLERAYDDAQKVTAEFNLNLLVRINRELGGEFDQKNFRHCAEFNEAHSRIEIYLVSACAQEVFIADLNKTYTFEKNERIHTEYSHKFSLPSIEDLGRRTGLKIVNQWFDAQRYFALTMFVPE